MSINKTEMASVPRELLERLAAYAPEGICGPTALQGFAFEAKRLLAAPAEDVREVVDEPVAILKRGPLVPLSARFLSPSLDLPIGEHQLYRHPQRKVVMPERESLGHLPGHEAIGWNACLDEFARLNK